MTLDIFPGARLRQLQEWGYPLGSPRPTPPASKAFSVIHITGNSRLPSADGEVTWRQTDPDIQNSATFFVNRDGSVVQALGDPLHMDPYANGDVERPDTKNPRIAAVVADRVNANERTLVAIENVGFEPGSPLTAAQVRTCAAIVRYYHAKAGVPVNRETVIGHYQLNSVDRPNCPAVDKSVIDEIVALAGSGTTQEEEEDAMLEWVNELKPHRARMMLKAGRRIFSRPSLSTATPSFLLGSDVIVEVIGVFESSLEYAGSNLWYVYLLNRGGFGCFPAATATVVPDPDDITQADVDRAVDSAISALNARIDAAQRGA